MLSFHMDLVQAYYLCNASLIWFSIVGPRRGEALFGGGPVGVPICALRAQARSVRHVRGRNKEEAQQHQAVSNLVLQLLRFIPVHVPVNIDMIEGEVPIFRKPGRRGLCLTNNSLIHVIAVVFHRLFLAPARFSLQHGFVLMPFGRSCPGYCFTFATCDIVILGALQMLNCVFALQFVHVWPPSIVSSVSSDSYLVMRTIRFCTFFQLRTACVHHGQLRGLDAGVPAVRQGSCRL